MLGGGWRSGRGARPGQMGRKEGAEVGTQCRDDKGK